ncbi:MAG: PhnD/SsuA/transferrin family substrate-binding protein [Desulfobacterales bacterium]|nr:MAG: PhnD/SsuA/transferrin family substrate-binding protein [Desulfobacterales bacterium]
MKRIFMASVAAVILVCMPPVSLAVESMTCWFPPSWKAKSMKAQTIADRLSQNSGLDIKPRIANSYPQILEAFSSAEYALTYVGSFVQAIIKARELGHPLVQSLNGNELYSGIMIYPRGDDPIRILNSNPEQIAYAVGASSGESSAKAATGGKATIGVANQSASAGAVKAGKAKAAFVKNWWWEKNKDKFPMLAAYEVPDVTENKTPIMFLPHPAQFPGTYVK